MFRKIAQNNVDHFVKYLLLIFMAFGLRNNSFIESMKFTVLYEL